LRCVLKQVEVLLGLIRLQLEEAKLTDRDAMSSMLIHEGEEMVFEIEEFKIRLAEKEQAVVNQLHVSGYNAKLSESTACTYSVPYSS
jgi:hypothetical protein